MAFVIRPTYTRANPRTGKKETRKSRVYVASYIDGNGLRVRKSTGLTDKSAAGELARDWEKAANRERLGIETRHEREALRPVKEHVDAWQAALESRGNGAEYVAVSVVRLWRILQAGNVRRLGDLRPAAVETWIQENRGTLAPGTLNGHVRAAKGFSRWSWRDGRLPTDPLAGLRLLDPKGDVRRKRRALSEKEIGRLLDATRGSTTTFRGLDGPARAALYVAAVSTGFRVSELASLRVGDFRLKGAEPFVRLAAENAKNRKEVDQPLPKSAARLLAPFLSRRIKSALAWPGGWCKRANAMLERDLAAAKLAREIVEQVGTTPVRGLAHFERRVEQDDPDGRRVDFHSLRVAYVTRLARAGVGLAQAQRLARHSTPALTANIYTRLELSDGAAAVERLPELDTPEATITEATA